ncbi:L-threonylcarbamoyladenylate synthase [Aeromicrobium duanguangcaii]|uniref:L-threonylcarbamoyladenylate synthase n=1 Tax=Aeromicrobium duanguangcaii TaxID=2968086 RepID=A0ABY5KCA6_9ACTN|nr:L-threonylcarbamoyladenylate synthase [Aeromicrobium duanguangcaii]MCD9154931.1 threonylcarbamoyl-AMP synthase [Aeromicrobium duanguangcaii]UUI67663.1 L-threonylcarbamoyladenylate synthase [Aeromicrobium duanguangcaii]
MRFDCATELDAGVTAAVAALRDGELVVLPTDTVYGIAADAFDATAVARLLRAKGRGRDMPPPVLIAEPATLDALVAERPPLWLQTMLDDLWPGPLTVVFRAQPSLTWDLGETHGTVAVRVPDDDRTRAVLRQAGPSAVSSANLSGQPAATSVDEAEAMLGESVRVYLDGGPTAGATPSTILDVTGPVPRVLRQGAVDLATLHTYNNTIEPAGGGAGA